jgi:cell division protein FtsZ
MILSNAGTALMGIGHASGDNRAVVAAKAAITSPLLEAQIDGARGILLNISGPSSMGLFEMNAAAEVVHGVAHPDANIIFGTVIDDELGDEIRVTVIAAGFDRWEAGEQKRASLRSVETQPRPVVRDSFTDKDPLDTSGDDDFDVPSFLK